MCHLVHFAMVAKMFVTWFVSKFIHWLNVGPLAKSVPNNPNYPKQLGRARILETYSKSQPENTWNNAERSVEGNRGRLQIQED